MQPEIEQNSTGRSWVIETDEFRVAVSQNVDFHDMTLKVPVIFGIDVDADEPLAATPGLAEVLAKAEVVRAQWALDTGKDWAEVQRVA